MNQQERLEKLCDNFREAVLKEFSVIEKPKKQFVPPSEGEVVLYFMQHGYKEETAKKAWKYYSEAEWTDSVGHKIKNWRQKMVGVWFKPENLAPVQKAVDTTNVW